ncbi:MAG: 3'-5' exonuclease [Putridiphycobacter sp.]|nr:3'-5' exonuclease [Putridiphycobacter sp.]
MDLNLAKPIVFFDLEATGLNITKDRIVEIGIIKVNIDGTEDKLVQLINPEISIPKEVVDIHGITNEHVANEPTFKEFAPTLVAFIGEADLAGYNSNKFDIPLLLEEFVRADIEFPMESRSCVDVQNIFHKMEKRTLEAAYQFYCQKSIENAHSAEADIVATYEVLKAQLDKYTELKNDITFLAEFSQNTKNKVADFSGRLAYNKKGELIYNFGKHQNKTIAEILKKEPGYHSWMLNNDFPHYTKKVLRAAVAKIQSDNKKEKHESLDDKLSALKSKFTGK